MYIVLLCLISYHILTPSEFQAAAKPLREAAELEEAAAAAQKLDYIVFVYVVLVNAMGY